MRHRAAVFAVLLPALTQACSGDGAAQVPDKVGDTYEISLESKSESAGSFSSGSSTSRQVMIERVVALRQDGLELEFDLPADTSEEDRSRAWQFPARVFKPSEGALELLNEDELEGRLDAWLERAEIDRKDCGKWIFTWTAFNIECDPQSVLKTLETYDLRLGDVREGAPHREAASIAPSPLRAEAGATGNIFVADFDIDPGSVHREKAEADVIVAEIMGDPALSFDAALEARSAEAVSGSLRTSIELDSEGRVVKRVRLSSVEVTDADGSVERTTVTETVRRRLMSAEPE